MIDKTKINFTLICCLILCFFSNFKAQNQTEFYLKKAKNSFNSNPDTSIFYCNEAEKINDYDYYGEVYVCKSRYFLLKSDYEKSEFYLTKAISIFKSKNKLKQLAQAYSLKSLLCSRIGEKENEIEYVIKAYEINKKLDDKENIINNLINLSYLENNAKDLKNAKLYVGELDKFRSHFDKFNYYYFYQNKGNLLRLEKKYDESLIQLKLAQKIAYDNQMIDSKATINCLIAESYYGLHELKKAEKFAKLGYNIATENNLIFEQQEALTILIKIYQSAGNYKLAFKFQEEYIVISNKILNIEKLNKIKSINEKLKRIENEKILEKKNLKIRQQKKLNETIQSKSKILSLFLIFTILSIIVVSFVLKKTYKLNKIIKKQKNIVEEKNQEILDSITYAKRIQSAILPQEKTIKSYFPNSFVIYKPKDIVAGDFYWFEVVEDLIFFAVADCTGHGVPGAMVSVVCHNALNRSLKEFNLKLPNEILDKTREIVISEFEKSDEEVKDGMDISLCVFNLKQNKLYWSGANNSLWILRKKSSEELESIAVKEFVEFKADKQPIGKFEHAKPFSLNEIDILKNDEIYFFTDGLQDQFGGEKGKKFKASQMRELLISTKCDNFMQIQKVLEQTFDTWKGDLEQVDDVCIIGVKI